MKEVSPPIPTLLLNEASCSTNNFPLNEASASIDKPWYHDAYGDSTGTSANYKADMTPQDVDVPERPPVKSVDITKKTEKPAKQPVQTTNSIGSRNHAPRRGCYVTHYRSSKI